MKLYFIRVHEEEDANSVPSIIYFTCKSRIHYPIPIFKHEVYITYLFRIELTFGQLFIKASLW